MITPWIKPKISKKISFFFLQFSPILNLNDIYFRLRFGLVNAINTYLRIKIRVV